MHEEVGEEEPGLQPPPLFSLKVGREQKFWAYAGDNSY